MKYKTIAMFAVLSLLTCGISQIGAYAEEDEEEDRFGFGIQEREREHQDEVSSPLAGTILYVTIGAIVAVVVYTAFKIVRSKRATKKPQ